MQNRGAVDTGLTRAEIIEAFTRLRSDAGWPKATRAMTALTRMFGQ
jgi:alkylhydroperoxidase/carboxymuconolactone decarboxylase family protein YurZ